MGLVMILTNHRWRPTTVFQDAPRLGPQDPTEVSDRKSTNDDVNILKKKKRLMEGKKALYTLTTSNTRSPQLTKQKTRKSHLC